MNVYVIAKISENGKVYYHSGGNAFNSKVVTRLYNDLRTAKIQLDKVRQGLEKPESVVLVGYRAENGKVLPY